MFWGAHVFPAPPQLQTGHGAVWGSLGRPGRLAVGTPCPGAEELLDQLPASPCPNPVVAIGWCSAPLLHRGEAPTAPLPLLQKERVSLALSKIPRTPRPEITAVLAACHAQGTGRPRVQLLCGAAQACADAGWMIYKRRLMMCHCLSMIHEGIVFDIVLAGRFLFFCIPDYIISFCVILCVIIVQLREGAF